MKVFDAAIEAIQLHRTYTVFDGNGEYRACHGCAWKGPDTAAADIHLATEIDLLVD